MNPAIIEVAINGLTTKDRNASVPINPEEISLEATGLIEKGAAIIHNHINVHDNYEATGYLIGEQAADRYAAGWAPVLARHADAIFCPTMVLAPTIQEKVAHLEYCAAHGARMGAVDAGSLNLSNTAPDGTPGDIRFAHVNTFDELDIWFDSMRAAKLGPSIGIFEPGFLRATLAYHRAGKLPPGALVKLYFTGEYDAFLGGKPKDRPVVGFGLSPTRAALDIYIEMMEGSGLQWSVAVPGGDAVASGIVRLALERGGHVRIGLEDYAGTSVMTNMQLLDAVLAECHAAGRTPATCAEAAAILGLRRR